jgi:hypothetical protein
VSTVLDVVNVVNVDVIVVVSIVVTVCVAIVDVAVVVVSGAITVPSQDHVLLSQTTVDAQVQMPDATSQTRSFMQSLSTSHIPDDVTCGTHLPSLQTVSSSHSLSSTHSLTQVHLTPSQTLKWKQTQSPLMVLHWNMP